MVEVMVKEALQVAEVATVVVEEVDTVEVVVEAMVMLPQGTLVEDSRCTGLQTQIASCSMYKQVVDAL